MDQETTFQPDQTPSEPELSFLDKAIGIFTEPSRIFESLKKFEYKTIDWLIPTLLLIVVVIISNTLIMSNAEIRLQVKEEQRAAMEKRFDEMVQKGQISREEADQQIERAEQMLEGGLGTIFRSIGVVIFIFLFLFILSAFYWLIWTKLLKGTGPYKGALSVYGLTYLIGVVETILVVILSLAMIKLMTGISVASFFGFERESDLRYFMSKLNPFTIWATYILGVGFGKIYNVEKGKSLIIVYIIWVVYVIAAKFIPFLNWAG